MELVMKKSTQAKTNGGVPADTSTQAEVIPFDKAVSEGKEIVARINTRHEDTERDHFRLGEIADKVETKYKDRTQARLATELGISPSCLKRYCSVYRAWKGINIGAPGPQCVSYSVRRELATHPEREEIVRANPNITKRQAQQEMRKLKGADKEQKKGATGDQEPEWARDTRGWLNKQVVAINAVTDEVNKVMENCTSEQRRLLADLDPTLLLDASQSLEKKAAKFFDWVNTPLEEAANALIQQGRVVTTPAPKRRRRASTSAQSEA
jgi:hypothetical protein